MKLLNWMLIIVHTFVVIAAAGHALLWKRDPRTALGWIAVCILFPLVGPFLYFLFGINRVRTRAKKLAQRSPFHPGPEHDLLTETGDPPPSPLFVPPEFTSIARISGAVTNRPLIGGNHIDILHNGEQAYPAMLDAIENARESLFMTTYIFDNNRSGRRFIEALSRATRRGVDVRVLIDGIGEFYAIPRAGTLLKKRGVRVARFLPPKLFPPMVHINLRNHRKLLIADGRRGFIGGMNIGDRHLAGDPSNLSRVVDVHFQLTGPVVAQIEEVFMADWGFATGEYAPDRSAPDMLGDGAICRTITEGPNEDLNKLSSILMGAVASARWKISIMTPYFLPSREMISAMQTAALRGVEVSVILPAKNNLPFVHWATRKMLWELLERGVRIFYQPPPFVHSKLFIVDDRYAQIGSANMDPRSLRLNFELAVEVYDRSFSEALAAHFDSTLDRSREMSLEEVDGRSTLVRTRDALAWLFSPYL